METPNTNSAAANPWCGENKRKAEDAEPKESKKMVGQLQRSKFELCEYGQQLVNGWLSQVLLDLASNQQTTPSLPVHTFDACARKHTSLEQTTNTQATHATNTTSTHPCYILPQHAVGEIGNQRCQSDLLSVFELRAVENALETGDEEAMAAAAILLLGDTGPAALTVKQPWARALSYQVKDIENRSYALRLPSNGKGVYVCVFVCVFV